MVAGDTGDACDGACDVMRAVLWLLAGFSGVVVEEVEERGAKRRGAI